MIRKTWILGAALAFLALAPPALARKCDLHSARGNDLLIGFDEAERFDLSELADGETRIFDGAERALIATRAGEIVTLEFEGADAPLEEFFCDVSEDTCMVLIGGEEDRAALMIMKSAGDLHGAHDVLFMPADDDVAARDRHRVLLEALGDGAGSRAFSFAWTGGSEDVAVPRILDLLPGSGTVLRCPEGDTTMRLTDEESADDYYCPRHDVLLEQVERRFKAIRLEGEPHEPH